MVLHTNEYELQQQKQNESEYETKLAKENGVGMEEYRAQKDLLDEANKTINSVEEQREDDFHDHQVIKDGSRGRLSYSSSPSERLPYSSLPSHPPTQNPSQLAIGSMVSLPTQCGDPLHGVVAWIGTLPEFPGLIAGVELVSHIALIH